MNNRQIMLRHARLFCKYPHKPRYMSNELYESCIAMRQEMMAAYFNLVESFSDEIAQGEQK